MAVYNPPSENLAIFDPSVFVINETPLTVGDALNSFLSYPYAQGTENLQGINVDGVATFNSLETHNQTETHNGQLIVNNNVTINNASVINQTDQITNVSNTLKSTNLYGDFSILSNGTYGGSIRFGQIGQINYGDNFTQQYQTGIQFAVTSQSLGGSILFRQRTSTNILRNPLLLLSTGSTFATTSSDGNNITLAILETVSGNFIGIQPSVSVGQYMPCLAGDNMIVSKTQNNALNNTALVIGCQSAFSNGIKIDSVNNISTLGQGGSTNGAYSNSFSCSNTASTINGPASFTSTSAPTSAQSPPLSVNDATTKIPTTAWVRSVINSLPVATTPLNYLRGSVQTIGTSASLTPLNFLFTGANWAIAEFFTLKIYFRQEWNEISTTANPIYYNSYTGLIDVYPYRCPTTGATTNLLSGSINGNTTFNITGTPTYAPLGRFYWTENYTESNTRAASGLDTANPIQITTGTQQQFTFLFGSPFSSSNNSTSNSTTTIYIELINPGLTNQSVTISGGTSFTNFYSTF